jgi:hypothetical protein
MKVVGRSSSLFFFLVCILLGLPVHRRDRRVGNGHAAVAGMGVRPTPAGSSVSQRDEREPVGEFQPHDRDGTSAQS